MKKKKTLSTQLTFVISFIVLLIVGVFWMANNTLLELMRSTSSNCFMSLKITAAVCA